MRWASDDDLLEAMKPRQSSTSRGVTRASGSQLDPDARSGRTGHNRRMHRPAWTLSLTEQEIATLRECMLGAANGKYFPNWEFHALIGADREEVRREAASWPETADAETQVMILVNSLGNLLHYPHDRGIREYVKSYPSKKLPRLLERVNDLASTSGPQ